MRTVLHATTCALCGAGHDCATSLFGKHAPGNGDATICARCGGWLIFDDSAAAGTRPPTPAELAELQADPRCQKIQRAWIAVKLGGKEPRA